MESVLVPLLSALLGAMIPLTYLAIFGTRSIPEWIRLRDPDYKSLVQQTHELALGTASILDELAALRRQTKELSTANEANRSALVGVKETTQRLEAQTRDVFQRYRDDTSAVVEEIDRLQRTLDAVSGAQPDQHTPVSA
jgi:ABC-type transporter Mla subunit MlaD